MKNCLVVTVVICFAIVHAAADLARCQPGIGAEAIKTAAKAEMKGIFEGIATNNYELYSKNFSGPMRQSQDQEGFVKLRQNFDTALGHFKSFEYLGFYVENRYTIALFKAQFSKIEDDVLVRLVLDLSKQKDQVVGLWFDSSKLAK